MGLRGSGEADGPTFFDPRRAGRWCEPVGLLQGRRRIAPLTSDIPFPDLITEGKHRICQLGRNYETDKTTGTQERREGKGEGEGEIEMENFVYVKGVANRTGHMTGGYPRRAQKGRSNSTRLLS